MLHLLTGLFGILLITLNTLVLIGPLMILALIKLLPIPPLRKLCSRGVMWIAETWAEIDKAIFAWLTPTVWDIRCDEPLRNDVSYLVVSNHQSWADIPALIQAFNCKTPYFKFFLKKELIWIPLIGLAFWALDYPFMKRYSKAYLEKHPELRGKDLEITRKACERVYGIPVTVVNYLEGTRFTPEKRDAQQSPYRNLLIPKSGGIALVLRMLGKQMHSVLDVTIVYPGKHIPGVWALLCGRVNQIIVDIRSRPLDKEICEGDYQNDPQFRTLLQNWVSQIWTEKDAHIETLRNEDSA